MENSLNLKPGQVMLVSAKAVKRGKIQLEFAQNLQTRAMNVLLNLDQDVLGCQHSQQTSKNT